MIDWIVTSSLLIVIIIALRAVLKGKISLRLQYGLWLLVLIRLLIPLNLPSQLSVLNLLPEEAGQAQPLTYIAYDPQSLPDLARPEINYELPAEQQLPQYEQALQEYEQTMLDAKAQTGIPITGKAIFYFIWIAGMLVMAVTLLVCNLRFDKKLKATAQTAVTMGCHLPTYFSDAVATPCLFGLFKPRIYLTVEAASRMDVMQYVLTHELAHYQHKDHIWSVLRCICLVLHWYNPLVWVAAILSKQDAELCCDETAIKFLGEHQRQSYGKALIDMSCVKKDVKSLLITATTMIGSKKALKERIVLIAKHPKTAVYTLILVILVAAIAVGCTFTGQQTEPADTTPSTEPSAETTEPAPTGYPEGEIQFILASVNGQAYIQDSTWMPQNAVPDGYSHIGVIRAENNVAPPLEDRHACHLETGTSLYANEEDDTYIFYWRYPQEENQVYRMVRMDRTDIVVDGLTVNTPPQTTGDPFSMYKSSQLCINGILFITEPYADILTEVPQDYRLYGRVQSQTIDEYTRPSAELQSTNIPTGSGVYLDAGPTFQHAYCQIETGDSAFVIPMIPNTNGFKIDYYSAAFPTKLPESYTPDYIVRDYKEISFDYTERDSGQTLSYSFAIPWIFPFSRAAINAQAQIHYNFLPLLAEATYDATNGYWISGPGVSYEYWLNGDILSIVIQMPTYADFVSYYVYNFDLSTGARLNNETLLKKLNITQEQHLQTAEVVAKRAFTEKWKNSETDSSFYNQQLEKTVSQDNLNAAQLYLSEGGTLNMILNLHALAGAEYYLVPFALP